MTQKNSINNPVEHVEAVRVARYLTDLLEDDGIIEAFTHVPHETFTRFKSVLYKNKAEGVKPGFPDYIIVTKTKIIFLELKRSEGGSFSIEQKMWLSALSGIESKQIVVGVAAGFLEAVAFIDLHTKDMRELKEGRG